MARCNQCQVPFLLKTHLKKKTEMEKRSDMREISFFFFSFFFLPCKEKEEKKNKNSNRLDDVDGMSGPGRILFTYRATEQTT
jgi:hypothetical protein